MRWSSVLTVFLLLGMPLSVRGAASPSLSESAQQLANRTAERLRRVDGKPTVAVFPFSNPQGRITAEMGDLPAFLQGELIYSLTRGAGGDFFVLHKASLARRFKDRGVAPDRIDPSDPERTGAILRQVDIDAAILGTLDGLGRPGTQADVKVYANLFLATGEVEQLVGSIDRDDAGQYESSGGQSTPDGPPIRPIALRLIPRPFGDDETPGALPSEDDENPPFEPSRGGGIPRFEPIRRLKVEVLVGGQPLPLLQCQNPKSPFCGNLFLIIPQSHLGREYQIRITNRASPPIDTLSRVWPRRAEEGADEEASEPEVEAGLLGGARVWSLEQDRISGESEVEAGRLRMIISDSLRRELQAIGVGEEWFGFLRAQDTRSVRNYPYEGIAYSSVYDPHRLIGVAVFVDGVNTRFLKNTDGSFVPVSRPPDRVPRWLLTPPGYYLQRASHRERWENGWLRVNDGRLVSTSGAGHSVLTLHGFQVDNKTARAFVFGDAGESLAEAVGITKEIGLISIYVFPEKVPQEEARTLTRLDRGFEAVATFSSQRESRRNVGTVLGRPLSSEVRGFKVELVERFRQVWKIHYRLEGEPLPVPRSELVPFEQ